MSEIVEEKPATVATPDSPKEDLVFVNGITADLLEDAVRLHLGKGVTKMVAYEAFIDSISSIVNKEVSSTTGTAYWLPNNVAYFSVSPTKILLSMYYPECKRNVKYTERSGRAHDRLSVIPNIIISLTLTKVSGQTTEWHIEEPLYMSTPKPLAELTRKHYKVARSEGIGLMPFTNFYTDGRMCFGQNVKPRSVKTPDLRSLNWFYEILFLSSFNDDLGLSALVDDIRANTSPATWYSSLATLAAENKPFPYKHLNLS